MKLSKSENSTESCLADNRCEKDTGSMCDLNIQKRKAVIIFKVNWNFIFEISVSNLNSYDWQIMWLTSWYLFWFMLESNTGN